MHSEVLLKGYGLPMQSYPYSFIPATDAFVKAIQLGLGYGMVPELQVQSLLENGTLVDIMLKPNLMFLYIGTTGKDSHSNLMY